MKGGKEITWIRRLLKEINCDQYKPTILHCDNVAAEKLLTNPTFHRRTKHIDVKFHYTRELVKDNVVNIKHVRSNEQLADMFTKPQTKNLFEANRKSLGVNLTNLSASGSVELGIL